MNIVIYLLILIFGLFFGNFFMYLGTKLSHKKGYRYSRCDNCGLPSDINFPLLKYIFSKGVCKNCKKKLSLIPIFIEFITPIIFLITYLRYNQDPIILNIAFSFIFVSTLIIVYTSDIKYMLIPDKILFLSSIVLAILKLSILYYNEQIKTLLDLGYEIIFLLYDGFFLFLLMYVIKTFGDIFFHRDSMGGGDIKLMFFVSMFLGWKLALVVLFFSAFIALPESILNMLYKKDNMIAFGPYIVLSTLLFYLLKVDFNMIINYLK